ncbi:MAG: hypothetical protein J5863_00635, partial [Desulfovibrio sp.]|nr:hypothetical protein [Desulfovibrio sp.]
MARKQPLTADQIKAYKPHLSETHPRDRLGCGNGLYLLFTLAAPVLRLDFAKMPAELQGTARLVPGRSDKGKGLCLDGNGRLELQPSPELQAA